MLYTSFGVGGGVSTLVVASCSSYYTMYLVVLLQEIEAGNAYLARTAIVPRKPYKSKAPLGHYITKTLIHLCIRCLSDIAGEFGGELNLADWPLRI